MKIMTVTEPLNNNEDTSDEENDDSYTDYVLALSALFCAIIPYIITYY